MDNEKIALWQGRRNYNEPDDPGWGAWYEVRPCDLDYWQRKAAERPGLYQLRALCVYEDNDV